MYKFTSTLNTLLTDYEVQPSDRETFTAILVSRAIAYSLMLPSSPVLNPFSYYDTVHSSTVASALAAVNEAHVIPFSTVSDQIRKVWMARYRFVFEPLSEEAYELSNSILNNDSSVYAESVRNLLSTKEQARKLIYAFRTVLEVYQETAGVPPAAIVPTPLDPAQSELVND